MEIKTFQDFIEWLLKIGFPGVILIAFIVLSWLYLKSQRERITRLEGDVQDCEERVDLLIAEKIDVKNNLDALKRIVESNETHKELK